MEDYDAGYQAGKTFAQEKVLELMNEVIEAYEAERIDQAAPRSRKEKLNAIKFMKSWVCSGGHTDFDGNRVCLPW